MAIGDDALTVYTAAATGGRPVKAEIVDLFAQLDEAALKDQASVFTAKASFTQAVTDFSAPENQQMRIGYDVAFSPFIGFYTGTTRLGFVQANALGMSLAYDGGSTIRATPTPGVATVDGSTILTEENSPTWDFAEGGISLDANVFETVIHGLGALVRRHTVDLRCTDADAGYEMDDVVLGYKGSGLEVVNSAQNLNRVKLIIGPTIEVLHEETSVPTAIDKSKWTATVRVSI